MWLTAGLKFFGQGEQLRCLHIDDHGELEDVGVARVPFAPLDSTNVVSMEPCSSGKFLLRDAFAAAEFSEGAPECKVGWGDDGGHVPDASSPTTIGLHTMSVERRTSDAT